MPRLALTKEEAADALSVCPRSIDMLIASGQLRPVRVGRRVLIAVAEIHRYLASATEQGGAA